MAMLKTFYRYKYLLYVLVQRDIKKKYRRSVLGVLWSMLNPLMMMIITAMVFSHLFRFDLENYILYLLIGQVAFTFFSEATRFAMGSILENSPLIKKIYVPKYLFPFSRVFSACVNFIFTIPAMIVMMVYTGQLPDFGVLTLVIPLFFMLIFCLGVGLILSAAVVFFRDVYHLYGVLLTALSYATPIFYPEQIVPAEYKLILLLNPLYYFLRAFREVMYSGGTPSLELTLQCAGISVFTFIVGVLVFRRSQNQFILYI